MSEPMNAREFRRQLDDVLRQRDPAALRGFLITAGQWDAENSPADLDRAMWMMIAASAALSDLHGEARRWLVDHGFTEEAQAILGRGSGGAPTQRSRGDTRSLGGPGQRAKTHQGLPPRSHSSPQHRSGSSEATPKDRGHRRNVRSGPSRRDPIKPPNGQGRKS